MDLDTLKCIVVPFLSGGLAGTFLKIAWDRWEARKKAKRLTVLRTALEFGLPRHIGNFKELSVAYDTVGYNRLLFYSLRFSCGDVPVPHEVPITIYCQRLTRIVDKQMRGVPLPVDIRMSERAEDETERLEIVMPPFSPGSAVEIDLVVDGEPPKWRYTGTDDVKILPEPDVRPSATPEIRIPLSLRSLLVGLLWSILAGVLSVVLALFVFRLLGESMWAAARSAVTPQLTPPPTPLATPSSIATPQPTPTPNN